MPFNARELTILILSQFWHTIVVPLTLNARTRLLPAAVISEHGEVANVRAVGAGRHRVPPASPVPRPVVRDAAVEGTPRAGSRAHQA